MIALVTGATSGIGLEICRALVANKIRVVACGRREDRLKILQSELGSDNIHTLAFDISKLESVKDAINSLEGDSTLR